VGFKIGDRMFRGRHAIDETDEIKNWPGLYAILCRRNRRHYLVDIGESDNVKSELKNNGRRDIWYQNCSGTLVVSVYYTLDMDRSERMRIERKIRSRHNPPCKPRGGSKCLK
jgi:hypothetical protein